MSAEKWVVGVRDHGHWLRHAPGGRLVGEKCKPEDAAVFVSEAQARRIAEMHSLSWYPLRDLIPDPSLANASKTVEQFRDMVDEAVREARATVGNPFSGCTIRRIDSYMLDIQLPSGEGWLITVARFKKADA